MYLSEPVFFPEKNFRKQNEDKKKNKINEELEECITIFIGFILCNYTNKIV